MKKILIRQKRIVRTRSKIFGNAKRPRLAVYRSLNHIYGQLIDDEKGVTLVAAKDSEIKEKTDNIAQAVGKLLAKKANEKKITAVVFDRREYKYHGRVKALADGARAGGLKI